MQAEAVKATQRRTVWNVLRRNLSLTAGCLILLCVVFTALFPGLIASQSPTDQNLTAMLAAPSAQHIWGTDELGRDVFTRMVYGARVSLSVSFTGVMGGSIIGVLMGVCAGYFGGWVDTLVSRVIDILLAFPGLLLAITIVAILGNGTENTAVAIGIFSIPSMARMMRGIAISLKGAEYIQACNVMGAGSSRIILTHIVPNCVSQMIVNVTLNLGTAILTASSLSFLGLGVQPPNPEWGAMLSSAREVLRTYPQMALVPGIAITVVVLSFSLVGDGLRDALDPKLKNS